MVRNKAGAGGSWIRKTGPISTLAGLLLCKDSRSSSFFIQSFKNYVALQSFWQYSCTHACILNIEINEKSCSSWTLKKDWDSREFLRMQQSQSSWKMYPSIHFLYPLNPWVVSRGGWSLSQRSKGERRGTPWTGRQSITGPHRDKQPHTRWHSLLRTILETPINLTCMFLDSGRKQEPGENPRIHEENMQTPHRKASAGSLTWNPLRVRRQC